MSETATAAVSGSKQGLGTGVDHKLDIMLLSWMVLQSSERREVKVLSALGAFEVKLRGSATSSPGLTLAL